ncbi:hypothetical protein A3742_06640 [Oleiphilus sp. HI0071]|nr:archaetidylserine decarboxylase [Oleiphilus sp. HI0080]KZY63546.1 hypothetical protein A3737_18460 [Oleiphilus sp. HI0065]KZY83526.1 hypothetical protein A3742_06640 [Oleiphilus sp. HI0071]KZY97845.1 hypothetical protein A3744_01310 [Oleiphilus sp. HI0073]KZZ50010.1 hypothetical protein A3760_14235 [Oleiphilus sp. HI0122]KZZ79033.1 hypothetical protein A3767_12120 [Oleiphilus sp. HI0133]
MYNDIKTFSPVKGAPLRGTLNFLVTNYIPRALSTRLMGRLSKVENPLFTRIALSTWQYFSDDMRLHEATEKSFKSVHACFTRELKPGTRPIDSAEDRLVSPCDAQIGSFGKIKNLQALQIKGMPYELGELTQGAIDLEPYQNGRFITLRLKSSMYHHMHSPARGEVDKLHYISGDTFNVNPPTLKRINRLFCRNERAVIEIKPTNFEGRIAMIPVAAILVASMRFVGLEHPLSLAYRGPNEIPFKRSFERGERIGNFEHGSTIVLLFSEHYSFMPQIREGEIIRMGQPLMTQKQQ